MRSVNGDSRAVYNTLETISAAASAIASSENRVPQAAVQKRRWGSRWSLYLCFGFHKDRTRIRHSVLVPETSASRTDAPLPENSTQTHTLVFPFVAPPSTPASSMQSEPPSAIQSPTPAGLLSLTSISASMYSPSGPSSIFAIGPYAHETQLVSPPVLSTFTTEPSTAPFTPPPESIQLTTPSSPEVPFAHLLEPKLRDGEVGQRFQFSPSEFQSYQFYPGSPVGQLISPGSGISGSGTSSPFPDSEFAGCRTNFIKFQAGGRPNLLNLEMLSTYDWRSHQGSGSLTPDAPSPNICDTSSHQLPDVVSDKHSENVCQNDQIVVNHRVSFELTAEDIVRCVEKKPNVEDASASLQNGPTHTREHNSTEVINSDDCYIGETSDGIPEKVPAPQQHRKQQSITLDSAKDFNFESADGIASHKSESSNSDWWANNKVVKTEGGTTHNWSFPMIQHGVS